MKNSIEEYEYHISYSEEDAAYIGTVSEFPYLSADGPSPAAAYEAIKSVVEAAVEILRDEGKDIPSPFPKGNIKAIFPFDCLRKPIEWRLYGLVKKGAP